MTLVVRCAKPRCPHGLAVDFGGDCFSGPEWANGRFGADGWALAYAKAGTAAGVPGFWCAYCWHHKSQAVTVTGSRSAPFALRCGWPGCEYVMFLPWGALPNENALARKIPAPMFFQYVKLRKSPLTRPVPAAAMLCPTHGMPGADDALAPTNRGTDA